MDTDREERSVLKESEARTQATSTTPPLSAITKVETRLSMEAAHGVRLNTLTLNLTERKVAQALGCIDAGILSVQLQTDISGKVSLFAPCTIWVGDIDIDDRRLSKALVEKLKAGTAAVYTDTFGKIRSKGRSYFTPVCEEDAVRPTTDDVSAIIIRALPATRNTCLMLRLTMANGQPLPFDDFQTAENVLSDLGAELQSTEGHRDIRVLFPTIGRVPQPTVQILCKALTALTVQGYVSMYNANLGAEPVTMVRPALHDAWNSAATGMHQ